jgi:Vanillate O-demethylase oxygenase C-terminal domain
MMTLTPSAPPVDQPGASSRNRSASITADFQPGGFALRDAWFPVVQARRVGRRPVLRPLHGQPVYLWRDNVPRGGGRLRAAEDPPAGHGRPRASEFTGGCGFYPLVERYGYAWVWYGNPDNASPDLIPHVPQLPAGGGLPRHFMGNVVFDCSYELVCENLLDLTHADFLHSWLTGDSLSEHDEISVTSTSETVTMTRTATGRPVPKAQRAMIKSDKQDVVAVTLVHVRSGICLLHGAYSPGPKVRMLHPANPESPARTRTPVTFNLAESPAIARHMFASTCHVVGRQDNWALLPQNDRYLKPAGERDMNSRFDAASLRYRKVYQELVARQRRGDYSYLADGDPARDVSTETGVDRYAD